MGTIVEFRLLVLDSLKYSSEAESPVNRSAKAVITRNLLVDTLIYLFIYFIFYIFTENEHDCPFCIEIATKLLVNVNE